MRSNSEKSRSSTEPKLISVSKTDLLNGESTDAINIEIQGSDPHVETESQVSTGSDLEDEENVHIELPKKVPVGQLFRFRDKLDVFLMVIGTLAALTAGCVFPCNLIVFGEVLSTFINGSSLSPMNNTNQTFGNGSPSEIYVTNPYENAFEIAKPLIFIFCGLGALAFVLFYLMMGMWSLASERQIRRIRIHFFRSVMRQDIGWFDTKKSGEITARFAEDAQYIHQAIGDKLALFLQLASTWIAATCVALSLRWDVALAAQASSPLLIIITGMIYRYAKNVSKQELEKYGKAGSVASEVFGAIRTVHAFQGQPKECERYITNLDEAKKVATKKGLAIGMAMAVFWLVTLSVFSLVFWYSVHIVQTEGLDPGKVVPILFSVMMGSVSLGSAFTYLETLSSGQASAWTVFNIIDTQSKIDSSSDEGHMPNKMGGTVEFRNVFFKYPSRPDIEVMTDFCLTIPFGKMVSLVGPSGCGKSTSIQLLQRFYDVLDGQVLVDGYDVRELNLKWLRDHIGVVSQEPVLFDTTIRENIRYGNMDVNDERIEKAARDANAHDFIVQLPQGYETMVGDRGQHLSGGQKQRIAIARALVKNPTILLLDEATSALDNESEALVQSALERAGHGRTTIVIAHRLSTVKDADMIVFMNSGQVVEKGTHEQLLAENGLYAHLVKLQNMRGNEDEDSDSENESDLSTIMEDEVKDDILKRVWSSRKGKRTKKGPKRVAKSEEEPKNNEQEDTDEKDAEAVSLKSILRLNAPEWMFLMMGCLGAMMSGAVMPTFATVMSEFVKILGMPNKEEQQAAVYILIGGMVGIGVWSSIAKLLQGFGFSKSGAALTARMRGLAFTSIVNQDMEFFDDQKNRIGYLTTRLSADAQLLQSTTAQIGYILEATTSLTTSIIIAFIFGWKLALVMVWFVPLMFVAGVVQGKIMKGVSHEDKKTLQAAGKVCLDSTENIRTVASLGIEHVFINKYESYITKLYRGGVKTSHIRGLANGASQCLLLLSYAVCFAYGSYLLQTGEMKFFEVVRVLMTIVYGGREGGKTTSSMEDYRKGKFAAGRLFALIERTPSIVGNFDEGHTLEAYNGQITMTDLSFRYKSRPNIPVLNKLSLEVLPGQSLALVGTSGCGKSTTIQIIERFYDAESGIVTANDFPVNRLNLIWWRSQMALVSQEPVLFDASISHNIAYGDNSREVGMGDIITAARMANIHTFIESLPEGYETNVGSRGTQLSGGQKQRIAIARALIRNPKILLLDEATSALDSESERIVQETLDNAREGRTCIIIAHRLSTVQNADKIAVIKHGTVVELGSHSELLTQKGVYAGMVQSQISKRRQSNKMY